MFALDGTTQTKPVNNFDKINDHATNNQQAANPACLIYALFTLTETADKRFIFQVVTTGVVQNDDLTSLCTKRRGANPNQSIVVAAVQPDAQGAAMQIKATDIPINQASRIVIELDPTIQWQFRSNSDGVTQKQAYTGADMATPSNQDLFHVNPTPANGNSANMPKENGCRLVFFDTIARRGHDIQGLNLHVELIQDLGTRTSVETIFDPDVPDVGGQFP